MTKNTSEQPPIEVTAITVPPASPQDELANIIEQLNQMATELVKHELLSKKYGTIALRNAIKTGELLFKSKEIITTNWKEWFKSNIKGFTERTAYNYIKLYTEKVKHVSVFDDCESIREAYKKLDIIKLKKDLDTCEDSKMDNTPAVKESDDDESEKEEEKKDKELTPEMFKALHPIEYAELMDEYKKTICVKIQDHINKTHGIDWNISGWSVIDERPASDESNQLVKMIQEIQVWLFARMCPKITVDDETKLKSTLLLSEILKKVIVENTTEEMAVVE